MQAMPRFEATVQLHALISDLRRRVQLLDADIEEEERKSRVFDPANHSYPMLALTMRERRDNLQTTVATLQKQLEAHPRSAPPEAVAVYRGSRRPANSVTNGEAALRSRPDKGAGAWGPEGSILRHLAENDSRPKEAPIRSVISNAQQTKGAASATPCRSKTYSG